jgi:hypothetical protein
MLRLVLLSSFCHLSSSSSSSSSSSFLSLLVPLAAESSPSPSAYISPLRKLHSKNLPSGESYSRLRIARRISTTFPGEERRRQNLTQTLAAEPFKTFKHTRQIQPYALSAAIRHSRFKGRVKLRYAPPSHPSPTAHHDFQILGCRCTDPGRSIVSS